MTRGDWISLATIGALGFTAPLARSQGCPPTEQAKLTPSDPQAWRGFGGPVALSGDTALIMARDDDIAMYSGAVYVFVRSGTAWTEQAKLKASDAAQEDFFGSAVSLSGDTALVGAFWDDDHGPESGSAYVFARNGTAWSEQAKLTAIDGASLDLLGQSVSLSGDTALLGAPYDDDNAYDSGSVYVFVRYDTTWKPVAKLLASDGAPGDNLGWSISLSGDTALVGAPFDDGGSAYVFVRNGTSWTEQAKLTASDGADHDLFGASVSLSNDLALVGAPRTPGSVGAAYVFVRNGTVWTEQAKLTASDGMNGHYFGSSLSLVSGAVGLASLSADLALVGAYGDNDGGDDAGAAYYYLRSGTTWTERAKLTASDAAKDDSFGATVALQHDLALVGAWAKDGPFFSGAGAAYVFDIPSAPGPVAYCTSKTGLVCGIPVIGFSGLPAASETTGFIIEAQPALGHRTGILFYTDRGRANVPFQGGTLCLMPPFRRSVPLSSGGAPGACDGVFDVDWNAFAHGLLGGNPQPFLLLPGQQVNVQVWGRDSIATGSYLSDALEYFVCG